NRPPAAPPPGAPSGPSGAVGPGAGRGGPGEGRGRGGLPGFGGPQTERASEQEVQYKKIEDKDIDSAKFAETLDPRRMVVVTAAVPYKRQVEEYQRALRAR